MTEREAENKYGLDLYFTARYGPCGITVGMHRLLGITHRSCIVGNLHLEVRVVNNLTREVFVDGESVGVVEL